MALALFCYRAAHLHAMGPHVEHVAGCGAGGTELPRLTLTCSFAVRSGSQKIFQSVLVQMHWQIHMLIFDSDLSRNFLSHFCALF